MKNKLEIEIESNRPLREYGDNHIIFYNASSDKYYITTYETFLADEARKIAEMKKEVENMNKELNLYKKNMDEKFSAFLETYKETNKKIIEMVKAFTTRGE